MWCAGRAALCAAIVVALAIGALAGSPAPAQTVGEIVAKNLEARGGVEKLRKIDTVKTTGKMKGRGSMGKMEGPDFEMPMTTWAKRPNKMRRETTFPDRTVTIAFDGTALWALDSATGTPQPLTGPQAEAARNEAGIDPLFLDYERQGHRIELIGTRPVDGTTAHELRVTRANGLVAHHFISTETGLEVRIVQTFEQGGIKAEVRTDLSDYRVVDGMQVPFTLRQFGDGKLVVEFHLEKVEFNVPIDDDMFRLAGKQP